MVHISLLASGALLIQALSVNANAVNLLHRRAISSSVAVKPSTVSIPTQTVQTTSSKITETITSNGVTGIITTTTSGAGIIAASVSTVSAATESIATYTVTVSSVAITEPTATSSFQEVVVTNPDDSSESVTFVKEDVPTDVQDQLPSIPADTLLPIILLIGGVSTPVLVSSAGTMIVPLTVPAWLTTADYPSPNDISETTEDDSDDSSTSATATTSTSNPSTTASIATTSGVTSSFWFCIKISQIAESSTLTSMAATTSTSTTSTSTPATTSTLASTSTISTVTATAVSSPTQTVGGNGGSSQCSNLSGACKLAYEEFEDDYTYTQFTSYTYTVHSESLVYSGVSGNGCAASFSCKEYGSGMSGADIKQAAANIATLDDSTECGFTWLSNGCEIILDSCGTDCNNIAPCSALPTGTNENPNTCY